MESGSSTSCFDRRAAPRRVDSFLQKPIQLSVTPRSAGRRPSERPLLSPRICGPATPHRPISIGWLMLVVAIERWVAGSVGIRYVRARSRPFSIYARGRDLSNGLPRDSWQIAGSDSTNQIAVYEPHALRLPVKSTRDSFRRLYRRSHASRCEREGKSGKSKNKRGRESSATARGGWRRQSGTKRKNWRAKKAS